ETEAEAVNMAKFYNGNVTATVCGRPVRITHSLSYPTIQVKPDDGDDDGDLPPPQCGSGRVVYIGQIPNIRFSDEEILTLAEPYGKIRKYFLHRIKRECFIEMEKPEAAEKMAEACKGKQLKFHGKRLTVYVSRKYKQLNHQYPAPSKRDKSPERSGRGAEEPPAKKQKQEEEEDREEEEEEEEEKEAKAGETEEEEEEEQEAGPSCDITEGAARLLNGPIRSCCTGALDHLEPTRTSDPFHQLHFVLQEEMETSTNQNGQTEAPPPAEPSVAALPPYDPDTPMGVEHVKMGYYCRLCFLFYSNEEKAKKAHCSSQAHYDKLQVSRPRPQVARFSPKNPDPLLFYYNYGSYILYQMDRM
uniref:Matrin 3-like 1.1 n=1 Tax=Xiphophorus couchianus TaxID=32473 RepID=A0A3B5M4X5_9TELE